jgi:photosystem II stability/assembly factor-like uncharacterized protein
LDPRLQRPTAPLLRTTTCAGVATSAGIRQVSQHSQVTQLATTSDGGRSWLLTGAQVPATVTRGLGPEQLVATSSSDLWALVGTGRLVATADTGAHWRVQPLPGTVSEVEVSGGSVWALTCVGVRPRAFACRPQVWRTRTAGSGWRRIGRLRQTAADPQSIRLAVLRGTVIVGVTGVRGQTGSFQLLRSNDRGSRWQARPVSGHGRPCDYGTALVSDPPVTAWLLCNNGGALGSSDKSLLHTTDAGQTWRLVASETVTGPSRPGQLQRAEPAALAAGSAHRLWLSSDNDLTVSSDSGRRWVQVRGINSQGALSLSTFDVLDASHAWLLGFDSGLWRTTNGVRWHRVGPLHVY